MMLKVLVFFSLSLFNIAKDCDHQPFNHSINQSFNYITYCDKKYTCGTEQNIVCKYKCEASETCGKFEEIKLTDVERQYIMDLHNYYRNVIAEGKDNRGGNGRASNMNTINYDSELEYVATCWAKQCQVKEEAPCRKSTNFFDIGNGQNLWTIQRTKSFDMLDRTLLLHPLLTWYNEIEFTRSDTIKNYHPNSNKKDVHHFTQLVWAETTLVGCGRVSWTANISDVLTYSYQLCCNYGPAGNRPSQSVYLYGTPASRCPEGKEPNIEYPGLCGEIKQLSLDKIVIEKPIENAVYSLNITLNVLFFCLSWSVFIRFFS